MCARLPPLTPADFYGTCCDFVRDPPYPLKMYEKGLLVEGKCVYMGDYFFEGDFVV